MGLEKYNSAYANTKPPEKREGGEWEPLADGKYTMVIDNVRLAETKKGDPKIAFTLKVMEGPHSGRMAFKDSTITETAMPYILADNLMLGLKLSAFSEFESRMGEIKGRVVEANLNTRNGYQRVFFNACRNPIPQPPVATGKYQDSPPPAKAAKPEVDDSDLVHEDDIPF